MLKSKQWLRLLVMLLIVFSNIGCDQASKKLIRHTVSQNEIISVWKNHFTITNVENAGAFLSMGDSLPQSARNILLSLIPLIVLSVAFVYALTRPGISKTMLLGLGCVIGGGIGNIFDRIFYGSVTDFLHLKMGILQTGIFNLADVSIMTGTAIILIHSFYKRKTLSQ